MKRTLIIFALISIFAGLHAQEEVKLYNPELDGMEQVDKAVKEAAAAGKHVFVQYGGNWCPWCILFNKFVNEDQEIKDFVKENYVVVHLNYSPENKNEACLERFGYPQRFGFPVFIILDGKGKMIHTQNSAYLEEGKGYNQKRVLEFFRHWTATAVDPASYKK